MLANAHLRLATVALILAPQAASATSAEVARSCEALALKSFPPRQVGNPAAGISRGSVREQQDFFRKCVANGGKMENAPAGGDGVPRENK